MVTALIPDTALTGGGLGRRVLEHLADGRAFPVATLADELGVPDVAIDEAVATLTASGVPVERHGSDVTLPWPVTLLDADCIAGALQGTRCGALDVVWCVDSTSSQLQRQADSLPDMSVVAAEMQSAARGQRGRGWTSPPGMNLQMSCLKRFARPVAALRGLSLAIGVTVAEVLAGFGIDDVMLKWPNDVMTDRGKLAGILVELGTGHADAMTTAVIGIGMNVRLPQAMRAGIAQPVADLADLTGNRPPDRNALVVALVKALAQDLATFDAHGFAAFHDRFDRHDWLAGKIVSADTGSGIHKGRAVGIDAQGSLRIETAAGIVPVDSAHVRAEAA